jgi:hypothetical protein
MSIEQKLSGVWQATTAPEIKVSGVWQTVTEVEIKVAGVWQSAFTSGPTVSASADGDSNFRLGSTCYAGAYFASGGLEYEYTNSGGTTSLGVGGDAQWLDSGSGSEVWVQFVRTGGSKTVFDSLGSGRYQLSSDRGYRINTTGSNDLQNITGYFRFYDAASGGNLLQQTSSATWTAETGTA